MLCSAPSSLDVYLMAIMRAVAMAAPITSVQTMARPSGACWSSGPSGGSLPVTRFQASWSPLKTPAATAIPTACFSVWLTRLSDLSPAIAIPRLAARHRKNPQRHLCRHHLTLALLPGEADQRPAHAARGLKRERWHPPMMQLDGPDWGMKALLRRAVRGIAVIRHGGRIRPKIGRASCRERV